jgi:hypothetical protein
VCSDDIRPAQHNAGQTECVGLAPRKISTFLRLVKDDLGLRTLGVYSIPCQSNQVHIGQTGRSVETRIKKHHQFAWLEHPDKSAVVEHTNNRNHLIKFLNIQILINISVTDNQGGDGVYIHSNNMNRADGLTLRGPRKPLFWVLSVMATTLRPFKYFNLRPPLPHCNGSSIQRLSQVEHLLDLFIPFLLSGHRHIPTLLIQRLVSSFLFFHFHFYSYVRWCLPYSFNYLPITLYIIFPPDISCGFYLSLRPTLDICLSSRAASAWCTTEILPFPFLSPIPFLCTLFLSYNFIWFFLAFISHSWVPVLHLVVLPRSCMELRCLPSYCFVLVYWFVH